MATAPTIMVERVEQRGRGNGYRGKDQHHERVVDAAGQQHHQTQLQRVKDQNAGRLTFIQARVAREQRAGHKVGDHCNADGGGHQPEWDLDRKELNRNGNCHNLTRNRCPAQQDQRT